LRFVDLGEGGKVSRFARLLAVLIAVQLVVGVSALARAPEAEPLQSSITVRDSHPTRSLPPELPWISSQHLNAKPLSVRPDFTPSTPSETAFAAAFPDHVAAYQRAGDPASTHWAVIVGVNRYQRAGDTLGSVADAMVLRDELLARGWRSDHVLVLLNDQATGAMVREALAWLARSTDDRSTVVFSMSGHIRHQGGISALWPTDSDYIWADEFGRLLGAVQARRLWASLQGCHAEGLRAPGVEGSGRLIIYSSELAEKSYEDPEVGHSVMGNYLFREGFQIGWGDLDGNGRVSVQEAFTWAAPRANKRTAWQQTPVIVDGVGQPFYLEIAH
jgi:hypothetical protein